MERGVPFSSTTPAWSTPMLEEMLRPGAERVTVGHGEGQMVQDLTRRVVP